MGRMKDVHIDFMDEHGYEPTNEDIFKRYMVKAIGMSAPHCRNCDEEYSIERWKLGYKWCMDCGEYFVSQTKRTIVPMHKSNYVLITDLNDLKGINNKGGNVK